MRIPFLLALVLGATVTLAAADRSFTGDAARPEAKSWRYVLTLQDKGGAVLRTIKNPQSQVMERARWVLTDTGEISVQFLNRAGQPRGEPLVWREASGRLTPLSWDKTEWGETGPPTLRGG